MNKVASWWSGLDFKWQLTIVIIVIIIIIILYKKYGYRLNLDNIAKPRNIEPYTVQLPNGQLSTVTNENNIPDSKKIELRDLADKINKDIKGANVEGLRNFKLYDQAYAYQDLELLYLSRYYKTIGQKVSLWTDMDAEYIFFWYIGYGDNSSWVKLKNRLEKIGEK